jgi:hypothetical protein
VDKAAETAAYHRLSSSAETEERVWLYLHCRVLNFSRLVAEADNIYTPKTVWQIAV